MDTDVIMTVDTCAPTSAPTTALYLRLLNALTTEHNPSSASESLLVDEAARRAAQASELDTFADTLSGAMQSVVSDFVDSSQQDRAGLATGFVMAERLTGIINQSQRCSRAMILAIGRLQEIGAKRYEFAALGDHDPRFVTELQCYSFLIRRFRTGKQPCARCGCRGRGCWIADQRAWECAKCNAQTGIRVGSVMEHSALPLTTWFKAIGIVSRRPNIKTAELAKSLSIIRRATVLSIRKRIRDALISQPNTLLGIADIDLPELSERFL
jgi:hypothetical protein